MNRPRPPIIRRAFTVILFDPSELLPHSDKEPFQFVLVFVVLKLDLLHDKLMELLDVFLRLSYHLLVNVLIELGFGFCS